MAFNLTPRAESVSVTPILYHGSPVELKQLKAYHSDLLGGKKVVYASPFRSLALCFAARWTDDDINLGLLHNQPAIRELTRNAFKAFDVAGWLYTVPAKGFQSDDRLGKFEMYSDKDVQIKDTVFIPNIMAELKQSGIYIEYYD